MATPTPQEIMRVKALGFLHNRGTDTFSARAVNKNGTLTAQQLKSLAECAEKYGDGHVAITSRLQVEMPGIHLKDVEAVRQFAVDAGLVIGGTGAKVRPLTACKGTTCVYGNADTQAICAELYDKFYTGWGGVALPHKFKIAVGGCPNSCMKPSLNDFGIEAHRPPVYDLEKCRGCKKCLVAERCRCAPSRSWTARRGSIKRCATIAASASKSAPSASPRRWTSLCSPSSSAAPGASTPAWARALSRYYKREELDALVEKTILWFRENAFVKERLGAAIDRVGVDAFEAAIATDDLLSRKDAILAAPLKERQA